MMAVAATAYSGTGSDFASRLVPTESAEQAAIEDDAHLRPGSPD